jgi:glycine/D-amino acid oxidase-like deaminating enzyme
LRLDPPALPAPRADPSWWLSTALAAEQEPPAAPLSDRVDADVCIVGGGYTGLWTALHLHASAPDLRVAILEAGVCGSGASGRNGGFALSWWDEFPELVQHYGAEQALFLARASSTAVDAIESLAAEEDSDVHFRRGGFLWASGAPAQDGAAAHALEALAAAGESGRLAALDPDEVRRRTGSPALRGGVLEPRCASVHPGLLVRTLRKAVLRRGISLFEGSPVTRIDRGGRIVSTARGSVAADKLVIAINAWAARLPELRRRVVPLSSQIIVTEPVPHLLAEVGWTGGELITDSRLLVHYTQVTRDGRVVFGRGGGAIGPRGRVTGKVLSDPRFTPLLQRDLARFWPQLGAVRVDGAWGGAVDRSAAHLPFFAPLDDAGRVHAGAGYSGNGVAPSHVGGRILASLALERQDEWATCGAVGLPDRLLPPEPFRSVGGRVLRGLIERKERLEDEGRRPDPVTRSSAKLVWLSMPSWTGRRRA